MKGVIVNKYGQSRIVEDNREITVDPKIETLNKIVELKNTLAKYKEDVEQVELFGMERIDYEEKKTKCAEIIKTLRELEKEVR